MTKEEFETYLESFCKQPGEFAEEDWYNIGNNFKSLPRKDKNWDWLVTKVKPLTKGGNLMTGEQYRMWVIQRQRKYGVLKHNNRLLNDVAVAQLNFENFKEETEEIKRDLFIEKQQNRDILNSYRRGLRDESRLKTFKESIEDVIDSKMGALPEITPIKTNYSTTDAEAILLFSDLHIGVEVNNFYNVYNIDIAGKRLEKLAEDTIQYCRLFKVKRLNIVDLGDAIQGLIHISARLEQQDDTVTQIIIASEMIARFLNSLTKKGFEITYRSCSDNHSRAVANLTEHIEKDNFNRIIRRYLETRLKDTDIKFIDDNIDYSIGKFDCCGKKIMFVHGHLDSVNKMFQNMVGATKEFIDYILLGHYHCPKQKVMQDAFVIINGSIVGTDQYALSKRLFTTPSQKLLVLDKDNFVDIDIRLGINK